MKRLTLVSIFMLANGALAAQAGKISVKPESRSSLGFKINPVVGAAVFKFNGSGTQFAENTKGLAVGAMFDFPYQSGLSFETGALYIQQGAEGSVVEQGETIKLEVTNNYLAIPALAKYTFDTRQPDLAVYVKGGLTPSFLLNSDTKASANGREKTEDTKSDFNDLDIQAQIGVGAVIKTSPTVAMTTDLSLISGLSVVNRFNGVNSWHNQGFLVTGGFLF